MNVVIWRKNISKPTPPFLSHSKVIVCFSCQIHTDVHINFHISRLPIEGANYRQQHYNQYDWFAVVAQIKYRFILLLSSILGTNFSSPPHSWYSTTKIKYLVGRIDRYLEFSAVYFEMAFNVIPPWFSSFVC